MKRITGLLFFVLVVSSSLFANEYESDKNIGNNVALEENRERRFSFMTSPMILLKNFSEHAFISAIGSPKWFYMDMEFQYGINEALNFSLTTAFSILSFTSQNGRHVNYQFILKPMLIYRPFRTGLDGFYIGWYSNIGWQQIQYSYAHNLNTRNFMQVGTGLNIGYKWIFRNGFTVQLGTGIGKTWNIPNHNPVQIGRRMGTHRRFFQFLNLGFDQADGRRTFDYFDFRRLDLKLGFSF